MPNPPVPPFDDALTDPIPEASPDLSPDVSIAPPPEEGVAPPTEPSPVPSGAERVWGRKFGLFAAALTGLMYYLAFPGADLWPFAFIAWVPWMIALRGATPGQAALQGLAVGLTNHFLGFYWLLGMLKTFSGFPTWICAIFMVLLCAYQGASFSLLGWLYARGARKGWPAGLLFTCAFVASETCYPLLFPFTYGATLHDVYPLVQVAEIGGPILVALSVLAPNWALALVLRRYIEAKRSGKKVGFVQAFRDVGWRRWGWLFAIPWVSFIYGMVRIVQVDEAVVHAKKIRVGIVQANVGLLEKTDAKEDVLQRHRRLTRDLVKDDKIDLAVWSETSVAGAVHEDEADDYYRRRVTRKLNVPTIVGAVLWKPVDDAREQVFFNSALMADKKGEIKGRYDKQFLLLFGEYLPWGEEFPVLYEYSKNSGRFSPGTSFEPLAFGEHNIATFICYEDIAPNFVNKLMQHGNPELLVNMTNDAWFGETSEPWEHMALSKMRAVEQRRYFVRSTNSGMSGFVDPVGRLTKRTEIFKEAAVSEDVALLKIWTPFRLLGYKPWWALSVVAFLLAFIKRPRRSAASA